MENKQREKKKESELNETNRTILQKIKAIKAEHPLWGYRRVTAWLRHREGIKVKWFSTNFKVVYEQDGHFRN